MRKPLWSAYSPSNGTVVLRQDLENDKREKLDDMPDVTVPPFTTDTSVIQPKTFGIPLTKLVEKMLVECSIPFVLIRICFIEDKGLDEVDLHPMLGNTQLVECLRTSFETGDAPLEKKCDVVTATMLLKMLFRELPDPVVPKGLCAAYIRAVQNIKRDKEGCVLQLKCLVEELPFENFNTLKFFSSFIIHSTKQYSKNKLTSLKCVVLGPEIFRLGDEEDRYRNELITKQLIGLFISNYSVIFGEDAKLAFRDKEYSLRRKSDLLNVGLHSNDVKPVIRSGLSTFGQVDCLKPLSITIPPVEDYITEVVSVDFQVPTLLVNSNQVETPCQQKMENTINPHPGRKRKECRSCDEKPQSNIKGKVFEDDEIKTWCLDCGTSYKEPESVAQCTTCEKKHIDPITMNWWDCVRQENLAELSPRPPEAKRREIDSSDVQPVLDHGGNSGSSFAFLDRHEVQRSAERFAPVGFRKLLLVPKKRYRFKLSGTTRNRQKKNLVQPSKEVFEKHDSENKELRCDHLVFNISKNTAKSSKHIVDDVKENFENDREVKKEIVYTSNSKCNSGSSIWHNYFHLCGHQEEQTSQGSGSQLSPPLSERHSVINTNLNYNSDEVFSERNNVSSFDFTFSDDHENKQEPVLSKHQLQWWPVGNSCSEDPMLSSCLYNTEVRLFEAPLSPSAGNCLPYLESLDPNLPPSPPKDQCEFLNRSFENEDKMSSTVKQLRKKIHSMKKKIRKFEEAFESDHGFKPSHADKMKYSEVKKVMTELNRVRKELKGLREEQQLERYSYDSSPPVFTGKIQNSGCSNVLDVDNYKSFKETVTELYQTNFVHGSQVVEIAHRIVTKDKLLENLASQKNGLKFEMTVDQTYDKAAENVLHSTQDHMKRLFGRTNFFAKEQRKELQPILEHVAMDFVSIKRTTDQMMEEDLPCLNGTLKPNDLSCSCDYKGFEVKDHTNSRFSNSKLHKLSLPELIIQQRRTRAEKKRLRKELCEIEEGFQQENERKMPQERRISMEPVYSEYKHAKGKLKLLEALMTKHELHCRI